MRLFLSSYRFGDHAGLLRKLLGDGSRALVISNALDNIGVADRRAYAARVYDPHRAFAELGVASEDLDLRDYWGDGQSRAAELGQRLAACDLVWAVGGNAFLLMRAMTASGFAVQIRAALARDEIAYGGWSAGAAVAGPSLRALELMDRPDDAPPGYDREPVWEGLGLTDAAIVPHFRSAHAESAAAEQVAAALTKRGASFFALRDGDVLIADGGPLTLHPRAAPA